MTFKARIPLTATLELYRDDVKRAVVMGASRPVIHQEAEYTLAVNLSHQIGSDISVLLRLS